MHILHPSKHLVQKELAVIVRQRLWGLDDRRQVGLEKLHDYIDIVKLLSGPWKLDALDPQNVFVCQQTHDL
jgi:hypothetical protein